MKSETVKATATALKDGVIQLNAEGKTVKLTIGEKLFQMPENLKELHSLGEVVDGVNTVDAYITGARLIIQRGFQQAYLAKNGGKEVTAATKIARMQKLMNATDKAALAKAVDAWDFGAIEKLVAKYVGKVTA